MLMKKDDKTYINYINIPYLSTGSVADIQLNDKDSKLSQILDDLATSLKKSKEKFNMDEYFEAN